MEAKELDELVVEARRMVREALLSGKITLSCECDELGNPVIVELGTKKADALLRTAEGLIKQRPVFQRRQLIDSDFTVPTTEG